MPTALVSATKRTGSGALRAELVLAGRSVLARQIDLARALGCERIVCLCEVPGAEVIARQREVETAGLAFHAVRGHLQLPGLVRADDEVLVLLDGLVVEPVVGRELALAGNGLRQTIATLATAHPLSASHPGDFERIDRERHWAGLAVIGGRQVHDLADLPPDGEAVSLLVRLALQARIECREVPARHLENDRWLIATDDEAMGRLSDRMVDSGLPARVWTGPSQSLAAGLVRSLGPRRMARGAETGAVVAGVLLTLAIVLAGFGYSAAGLGIAALGLFAASVASVFARLRHHLAPTTASSPLGKALASNELGNLALLLATVAVMFALERRINPLNSLAIPVLAMGLGWLSGRACTGRAKAFWRDSPLHLAILAAASLFGMLEEGVILFALGALLHLMLNARKY